MSTKKIEILENTLLKLLVRRGLEQDRRVIVLSEGELGYTTDTKRLYIGDGSTAGGVLAGNKFIAINNDHETYTEEAVKGDLVYNTTKDKLYTRTASAWEEVGGVYEPGNNTIVIDGNNQVFVGTLSANNFSNDAVGNSIVVDSGRISLNGQSISTDKVVVRNNSHLDLPGKQKINSVDYNWPTGGIGSNLFLQTDITGNLSWSPATAPTTFFFNSTGGPIPVGTIMPYVSSGGAPYGWLLCNGQEVNGTAYPTLSAVIGNTFGTTNPGVTFKVPNYINTTLYGTGGNPAGSTIYRVSSGTNSSLSAQGSLYIIKAIPDRLVSSTITTSDGLTAYINGQDQTGIPFTPLSGSIQIGLERKFDTDQTINGGSTFDIDEYGRVTSVNTVSNNYLAGDITTTGPYNTNVVNNFSPFVYLRQPVGISRDGTFTAVITAYPFLTDSYGTPTGYSVGADATGLIVESFLFMSNRHLAGAYASLNTGLAGPAGLHSAGSYEYTILHYYAHNKDDDHSSCNTTFIPLSTASNGSLQFVLRGVGNPGPSVRVIGYTR